VSQPYGPPRPLTGVALCLYVDEIMSRDSLVGKRRATAWTTGIQFPTGAEIFISSIEPRRAPGPTRHSVQYLLTGGSFHGSETHSPSSTEFKNGGAIPPPPYAFMAWYLIN
jgi:hypothetical protein